MSIGKTYVIGDVHGCVEEVDRLLEEIAPADADTVCFLGDYIDRGPSPRGVVDRLLRLETEGPECIFLKGNHEDMFLAFLGLEGHYGEAFLSNGGGTTLESYGLGALGGQAAAAQLPEDHLNFFLRLRPRAVFGSFLCVHAGVRPSRSLEEQSEEDLLWIRGEFISATHSFPYTVLYGHTPKPDVFLHLPYKIGLDTGLVYGNRLSCLELREKELLQLRRGSRQVVRQSLASLFASREASPA